VCLTPCGASRDFPARAVAARQAAEQQLSDVKLEAADLGTELAALKVELKKARARTDTRELLVGGSIAQCWM